MGVTFSVGGAGRQLLQGGGWGGGDNANGQRRDVINQIAISDTAAAIQSAAQSNSLGATMSATSRGVDNAQLANFGYPSLLGRRKLFSQAAQAIQPSDTVNQLTTSKALSETSAATIFKREDAATILNSVPDTGQEAHAQLASLPAATGELVP